MVGILENPVEPMAAAGPSVEAAAAPKRIKRLERPNKAALDEELGRVFDEIEATQGRIHEIKALIDNKHQNKQAVSAEVQDARNRLSELNSSFRSVVDEKRALLDELDQADKLRERMRADARSLRDKLPYVRVEQIDEEIKKMEYRMTHTSLSLQEEKKLLQQVKDLSKSRDFVKDYNDRLEQITQDEGKIREKDRVLNNLKAKQEEQRKVLAQIKEQDASQALDIPALIEERNGAFEKLKALREQMKEVKAEFRSKDEEYWERERQIKEQQAIQRRKDYEKREADRKEREKIRKQRELENYVEPYTDEIIMVDQLSSYLLKYAPAENEATAASSATPQKADIVAPKGVGLILVSKKNKFDEETDSWFSGKGKGKKSKAPPGPKNKGKEKLSLSLDALTSFEKVKLSPPTTVGDVAKSIEDLKLKKEEFIKLQKEARERRERGEPEPKPIKQEEPVKVVEAKPIPEIVSVNEPTPAEAHNGFYKTEKVTAPEPVNEVGSNGKEDAEAKPEEDQEPKLPEDLEAELLSEDHDAKLPEDLEGKLPGHQQEAELPEDLDTKVVENLETTHPEEAEDHQLEN